MSNRTERPAFHHPEVEILYDHDLTIVCPCGSGKKYKKCCGKN